MTSTAWRGIVALIQARVADGSFGATYPENCSDPNGVRPIGTDDSRFWDAMRGDNPGLPEPYEILAAPEPLPTLDIMDIIEFCWRVVGKPIQRGYHSYFQHHHLDFDIEAGRADFREAVNQILRRNGLAYELSEVGERGAGENRWSGRWDSNPLRNQQLLDSQNRLLPGQVSQRRIPR